MNIFRGLLDLISGKPKADVPQQKPGDESGPVPVLEEILSVLKSAKPPAEARESLPAPPPQIEPSRPTTPPPDNSKEDPAWVKFIERLMPKPQADAAQGPPPTPATTANTPAPAPEVRIPQAAKQAAPTPARPDSGQPQTPPPPPVVNVPPANVTVSPPAANAPAMGNQTQADPRQEGMLAGFVARFKEVVSQLLSGMGNIVSGMPKGTPGTPQTAAPIPPQQKPANPQGTPTAPTGTQQPTGWRRHGGKGGGGNFGKTGDDFQPKKPDPKGAGGMLAGIGGFVKLAGVVTLITGIFTKAVGAVTSFVTGTHAANEELRNYSGQLAVAFANLDIQKLRQNMQLAQNTSGSGSLLANEIKNLKDEFQPLREMSTTFKNKVAANFVASTAGVVKIATDFAKMLGLIDIAKDIEKNTRDNSRDNRTPGVQMAQELASGEWQNFGANDPLPPIN